MKHRLHRAVPLAVVSLAVAMLGAACSTTTTSSTRASALKPTVGAGIDLRQYQKATVIPFVVAAEKKIDASVGAKFAEDVAIRLQHDFGALFQEIRRGTPSNGEDELIVTGTIKAYEPGSKFGRAMLIGVGAASFEGDVTLKKAQDGTVLFNAPFDKLWAWGGMMGVSKGIEDMVSESAAAVANTVAQAKGWKPAATAKSAK